MTDIAERSTEGFTLIETLVVLAIMAVLSAMLIAYNHSSTTQLALTTDQATVAGVLNRAKTLTLEKYNPPVGAQLSVCAYGVHFTNATSTYLIYAVYSDSAGNLNPNANCGAITDYAYAPGSRNQQEIQQFQLDAGIRFAAAGDIYFIPPYLEASSSGAMQAVLQVPATGATATISVSPSGGVNF